MMYLISQGCLQVVFQAAAEDGGLGDGLQGALGAQVDAEVRQASGPVQINAL